MFATTLALVFAMSTQRAAGLPSDSTELEPAGSYPFRSGSTVALDTARSLAFVGAGSGVFVVDVANPSEPRILSDRIRCGTLVKDMLLAGTRLYVALLSFAARPDLPRDVEVWDVSVATQPLRLGGIDLSFGAQCVHAIGDTLLVGSLRSLFTYDVSDPGNPVRLDSVPHWSMADEICVRDTLAYVSSSAAGVQVYNLRSPAHPSFIAEWGASCSYPGLDVVGDRLYLVGAAGEFGSESGLRIYDVADPRQGQLLGVFDTAMTSAYRVAVFDTIAAVCYRSSEGVKLVSVADPSAPAQLSARGNDCMGVAVHGSVAYLAFRDRFEVLGVADPSHPVSLGSVPLGLAGSQLVVDRGMVYSVGGSFAVLDAHSSLDVELAGALDLGAHSWALSQSDSVALVAVLDDTGGSRVDVVMTTDPHAPWHVSTLPTTAGVRSLLADGPVVYAASESGLDVFDISDPSDPVRIGGLSCRLHGSCLLRQDTFLFATDSGNLVVMSVANPSAPGLVTDTALSVFSFLLSDTFLYALPEFGGRGSAWSIGALPTLRFLREFAIQTGGTSSAVCADTTMVLGGLDLLSVYSLSQPAAPALLGTFLLKDQASGLALAGDTLYTSLVTRYRLVGASAGIELEPIGTGEARQLRVWPSVARGRLYIEGCTGAVLVDGAGRRVMDLKRGANDVRPFPPGVYFVREQPQAASHKLQAVRKVVLAE